MPQIATGKLAELLGATLEGDPEVVLSGVAGIGEAGEGDLSFVADLRYVEEIGQCKAAALIVSPALQTGFRPLLRSRNPYVAFVEAIKLILGEPERPAPGIHPSVVFGRNVTVGRNVSLLPHVVLEDDVVIGDGTVLYPSVFVGRGARIGRDGLIYHRVIIGPGCQLGDRALIHSGAVVGGPPQAEDEGGAPSHGIVEAAPGQVTRIGSGTKMDNLVMVGSGATLGRDVIVVAQAGLGSGCIVEDGVTIAGKSLVAAGVRIGAGATLAGRTFATHDVPPGETVSGSPARPHSEVRRMLAHLSRLPELADRIDRLEEKGKS